MLMKNTQKISELYSKYHADIFHYSLSLLKNQDDALDCVQEVFLKCSKSIDNFRGDCTEKTWLMVIARNYCFKLFKSKKNILEGLENFDDDNKDFTIDDKLTLDEALKSLSKDNYEILYLKEYAGFSYKEIAEILHISLENVKIRLFRIRKQLKDKVRR